MERSKGHRDYKAWKKLQEGGEGCEEAGVEEGEESGEGGESEEEGGEEGGEESWESEEEGWEGGEEGGEGAIDLCSD
jgi:hypothetical protein